jgi:hypothetical protein
MTAIEMHPDLAPLAFLLGRWQGEARSLWEGPEVVFGEEVTFEHFGKPALAYRQRAWRVSDLSPSHSESGFLSPKADGLVTVTIAQPTGVVEVSSGTIAGTRIDVGSVTVALAPDAKPVTGIARSIGVDKDGALRYLLRIALNYEPLADHMVAELHRVEE